MGKEAQSARRRLSGTAVIGRHAALELDKVMATAERQARPEPGRYGLRYAASCSSTVTEGGGGGDGMRPWYVGGGWHEAMVRGGGGDGMRPWYVGGMA